MLPTDWPDVLNALVATVTVSGALTWALTWTAEPLLWLRLRLDWWVTAFRISAVFIALVAMLIRLDFHPSSPCLGNPESAQRIC